MTLLKPKPRRGDAGYALFELMVALAVLALLAQVSAAFILGLTRQTAKTQSLLDDQSDIAAAQSYLRASLRRALSAPDAAGRNYNMTGDRETLNWLSARPVTGDAPRLVATSLFLSADGNLILREAARGQDGAISERVLVDEIQEIDIAYAGRTESGLAGGWTDHWTAQAPPALLRINLLRSDGVTASWPPLYIDLVAVAAPSKPSDAARAR